MSAILSVMQVGYNIGGYVTWDIQSYNEVSESVSERVSE